MNSPDTEHPDQIPAVYCQALRANKELAARQASARLTDGVEAHVTSEGWERMPASFRDQIRKVSTHNYPPENGEMVHTNAIPIEFGLTVGFGLGVDLLERYQIDTRRYFMLLHDALEGLLLIDVADENATYDIRDAMRTGGRITGKFIMKAIGVNTLSMRGGNTNTRKERTKLLIDAIGYAVAPSEITIVEKLMRDKNHGRLE